MPKEVNITYLFERQSRLLNSLLILTPLIAMVNGVWLYAKLPHHFSPGQIFGGLVLVFALIVLFKDNRRKLLPVAFFALSATATSAFVIYSFGYLHLPSIIWWVRILYTVTVFLVSYEILRGTNLQDMHKLRSAIYVSAVIIAWSLILFRLIDFGFHTYSSGVGFKGLFYGQNDLSASLSMLFPIVAERVLTKARPLTILNLIVVAFSMVSIGTKTALGIAIMTVLLLIGALLYRSQRRGASPKFVSTRTVLIALALVILIALFFMFAAKGLAHIVKFQTYFLGHSKNLLIYLLSGRTESLPYVFHTMSTHPLSYLLGVGFQNGNNLLKVAAGRVVIVEFDPVSVLFAGGAFLCAVVLWFYYPVWRNVPRGWRMLRNEFWLTFSVIVGVFASVFAGHVLESALAGTYFSVLTALWSRMDKEQSSSFLYVGELR